MVLSLEQYSIAFSLDYWWFSGELRHKHSIKDELLLLSQNLPWSKIIYFPAGFQLHLLIISYLLLKFWVVFLFHSIIFVFCYWFCVSFLGQGSTTKATCIYFNWQDLRVPENWVFLWPSGCPVSLFSELPVCYFQTCYFKVLDISLFTVGVRMKTTFQNEELVLMVFLRCLAKSSQKWS